MDILLTGAGGFIGRKLIDKIAIDDRFHVRRAVFRKIGNDIPAGVEPVLIPDLGKSSYWKEAFNDIDVVIHTAARAHILKEENSNSLALFRDINVTGTENLAWQAANVGVRRFIFISSIGINGASSGDMAFTEESVLAPCSPYAISKYEAELKLREIEAISGMDVTIIRVPLVYGENPKGNIAVLLDAIYRGIPFPFALVKNKRTLIALDNLVDFILTCAFHPYAGKETFLVGDSEDISTPELIVSLANGMNKKAHLLPIPITLIKAATKLLGKEQLFDQLCGSLRIDIGKCQRLLGWNPPVQVRDGLVELGSWYIENRQINYLG